MSAGIDYGLGMSNVDHETGIRYGVISSHSVSCDAIAEMDPVYPPFTCPSCDGELPEFENDDDVYVCPTCGVETPSRDIERQADYAEPTSHTYERDGYALTDCLDSDVFVLKSPYFTHAQFCSPCVPGAGNLDSPDPDGVKTYALGHDWFEDGRAPYPVYAVATGEIVEPD